jgi:hypothetical protein
MGGIILGIFLLGVVGRRANSSGVILGSLTGLALVLYVFLYTSVAFYWYSGIGALTTFAIGWTLSPVLAHGITVVEVRE